MGAHEGHLHVSVMSINEHVLYSHKSPSSKFADIYSSMQNLSCANSDLRGPTSQPLHAVLAILLVRLRGVSELFFHSLLFWLVTDVHNEQQPANVHAFLCCRHGAETVTRDIIMFHVKPEFLLLYLTAVEKFSTLGNCQLSSSLTMTAMIFVTFSFYSACQEFQNKLSS